MYAIRSYYVCVFTGQGDYHDFSYVYLRNRDYLPVQLSMVKWRDKSFFQSQVHTGLRQGCQQTSQGGYMIINHNMSAINSNRQLAVSQAETANNMEKLSSGLRINKAADVV